MHPEVVKENGHYWSSRYPASSVLILAEEDGFLDSEKNVANFWLANTTALKDQGFTVKVDNCRRTISGVLIKNLGKGLNITRSTKEFRVSGSSRQEGPWIYLV